MKKWVALMLVLCGIAHMCGCASDLEMSATEKYDKVIRGFHLNIVRTTIISDLVESNELLHINRNEVKRYTSYHETDSENFKTDVLLMLTIYIAKPLIDASEPVERDKFALAYKQVLEIDETTLEFNTLLCSGLNPRRLDTEKACEMAKVFDENREFYPELNPEDIKPLANNLTLYARVTSNLMIQQTLYLYVGEDELMEEREELLEELEEMLKNEVLAQSGADRFTA